MTDRWFDATNKTYVDFTPEKQAEVDAYKQDLIDRSKDRKLESIRQLRLKKLEETDWMASNDVTMPENIKTWRQSLRDIPQTYTTEAEYDLLLEVEGEFPNKTRKHAIWSKP